MLEYPIKSGIFEMQRRGNLADSDLRLQILTVYFQDSDG
jgi:hypothetical protein